MRIVHAGVTPICLTLNQPLATAHGPVTERCGAVVTFTDDSGATGWGEALPLPGFGLESVDRARQELESTAAAMVGAPFRDLEAALAAASGGTKDAPAARAAIDVALHDMAARSAGSDLAAFLDPARRTRVSVNALVGGTDIPALEEAARNAIRQGFGTLKLKVGWNELARDIERIAAVRAAIGPEPRIRADANGAWTEAEAVAALRKIAAYDVEFVEQPVPAADIGALARLRAASPVRIAADEAIRDEATASNLLEAGAADVLVLKPAVVGGLGAARRIAERAQRAGVDIVVTSFLDSSLGIAAALHLAAALPAAPFASGLASATWLRDDLCTPLTPRRGWVALPATAGLGVCPDPEALRRCARGTTQEFSA